MLLLSPSHLSQMLYLHARYNPNRKMPRLYPMITPILCIPRPDKKRKGASVLRHMLSRTLNWYLTIASLLLVITFILVFPFRLRRRLYSRRIAGTARPPPPPSRLGTAFRPTLFPGISTRGTPPMVLGSFIKDTSS
jgi:hypothetical protein